MSFFSEEEKDVLCTVNVPKCPDHVDPQEYQLAVFHLDYFNVIDCVPQLLTATAVTTLTPEGPEVHGGADEEIELQRNRCEAAQVLVVATEMADQGDYTGASRAVRRCVTKIQASHTAAHELSRHLVETLEDAEGGLRDKTSYVQYGKHAATSYSEAHWQQRSNCSPQYASKLSAPACSSRASSASALVAAATAPAEFGEINPYRKGAKARMVQKFKNQKKK